MGIIKRDFNQFYRPMLLYIIITQVLIFISANITDWFDVTTSVVFSYFVVFVIVICSITVFVFTILFAIYFNTKSNSSHIPYYQLTDGYGLYRFITSSLFLIVLIINFIVAAELNGFDIITELLKLKYYQITGVLFGLIPLYALIIISIAHAHKRPIFRNVEAVISFVAIFIGIYIAGNLYYFDNQQQGVAVLVALFIPLSILFMSFKERNSSSRLYKIVIFILCILVTFCSVGLFVTSDFSYNTDQFSDDYIPSEEEQYPIEFNTYQNDYTEEIIETPYGDMTHFTELITEETESNVKTTGEKEVADQVSGDELYILNTEKYAYRINVYGGSELSAQILEMGTPNLITIYDSPYQTEAEFVLNQYDSETDKHITCNGPLAEMSTENSCQIDQEIVDVYNQVNRIIEKMA